MSDYEAALEKRIGEQEEQMARLSYIIRPHFMLHMLDSDKEQDYVKVIQLFVKIKSGIDPLRTWEPMAGGVVVNNIVANDFNSFGNETDPVCKDIVCHCERTGNRDWHITLFRSRENYALEVTDMDEQNIKQLMLQHTGLSGLISTEHKVPYVSKEDRMKPAVEELTKKLIESNMKLGVSSNGFAKDSFATIRNKWAQIYDTTK
jgi:hypothetical protein